jgi:hypothetical protein
MMRASARFSRFVWRPATFVRFVWTAAGRAVSLILGAGLHGTNPPAAPKRCFLRVADDPTGGTGKRYAVTDELVTQSIYRLTATYG